MFKSFKKWCQCRVRDWLSFKRNFTYECDYLFRLFRLDKILVSFIYFTCFIFMTWGSTQSSLSNSNPLIPKSWTFFQDTKNTWLISIVILLIVFIIDIIRDFQKKKQEKKEVTQIIEDYILPSVNINLQKIHNDLQQKFQNIQGDWRISLWIPVRVSFLRWNLQMVSRTSNIPDRELKTSFKLHEGVIGNIFLRTQKYHVDFIDLEQNSDQLFPPYCELQQSNATLIKDGIVGVLVASGVQESSVVGLLALDTDDPNDIDTFREKEVRDMLITWVIDFEKEIAYLWRARNNV